jgi:uncharacterized delta-60 repeat protein
MKFRINKFIFAITLALVSTSLWAGGALDTSFNGFGKKAVVFTTATSEASSVIKQSDGKLFVAGNAGSNMAVVRLNADGSLDTTFSGTGKKTVVFTGLANETRSAIQQSDGKLVVAGDTYDAAIGFSTCNMALVRLNTDGSLDTTFNTYGKKTIDFGGNEDIAYSVIQQNDGKLVVAGRTRNSTASNMALVRLNTDGSLDSTFNGTGKKTVVFTSLNGIAYSVIQQGDGKLVIVGDTFSSTTSSNNITLVRLNTDGSLDTTFNGNGKKTVIFTSGNAYTGGAILQSDGKLVVAGDTYDSTTSSENMALARLNTDGSLDTTFDGYGKKTIDFGGNEDYAWSMIQQNDGKLVIAGETMNSTSSANMALVRLNTNGSLDTTFDGDGKKTVIFTGLSSIASSVIQQGDGKLVVAGNAGGNMAVVRLLP